MDKLTIKDIGDLADQPDTGNDADLQINLAKQLLDAMRDNERLRKALEFADNAIYSEFCTGNNEDGSPRIALEGYQIIKEALSNKDSV